MPRVTKTTTPMLCWLCWTSGGLESDDQHYLSAEMMYTDRFRSSGKFASRAPRMLQIQSASPHGNGCFVTWARIIRPTWWANCRPQAHKKGTKSGELMIAELLKDGDINQETWMAADTGKGSRCSSGRNGLCFFSLRALKTLT